MRGKINIIFGATASGKTSYGISLAQKLGAAEIINIDSMQIYKEIPILSAQPTAEEMSAAPHHLFGFKSLFDKNKHSAVKHAQLCVPIINDMLERGITPILIGGTGMYIEALVNGFSPVPSTNAQVREHVNNLEAQHGVQKLHSMLLDVDPVTARELEANDSQRIKRALEVFLDTKKPLSEYQNEPPQSFFNKEMFYKLYINRPRDQLYKRIDDRFDAMLAQNVAFEVLNVIRTGHIDLPPAHGLLEFISYFFGDICLSEAVEQSKRLSRNYAKRQRTWARGRMIFDEIINIDN
jgi:tRNA dimethylallyltransferase